jgi:membrane-bound lytic murein transglycosylase D
MHSSKSLLHQPLLMALLLACLTIVTGNANANVKPPDSDGRLSASPTRMLELQGSSSRKAAPIWNRMRAGFKLDLSYSNKRIEVERRWYQNNPEYLQSVFKRAEPFLFHLVTEAEKRQLPLELVLLPVVESAFDPFAYSYGQASGIWQFIPGTGKRFGLKQNWWYDGRRDVMASTQAALEYLERLNRMFDGDWLHALASYNAGEGNVLKSVRRNQAAGLSSSFWALSLPQETEVYVPRLLALAQVIADPARYNIQLRAIANEPKITAVKLDGQLDLHQAAQLAGISLQDIYQLNSGFNRWATDPDGPHRLVLPLQHAETFKSAYRELPPQKRIKWVRHHVKAGDSLVRLAQQYRTTPEVIQSANMLDNHLIRLGSRLLIPTATTDLSDYKMSAENRLSARQGKAPGAAEGKRIEHRVNAGDTLWDIARKYEVSSAQLARWNGMAPGDLLRPGNTLVIWQKKAMPAADAGINREVIRKVGYQIRDGDSLSSIANKFNVSVKDLEKWNAVKRKSVLQPGRHLRIYVDVTATSEQGT